MKKGSRNGATPCEEFHEEEIEGGLLYWGTQRYIKQGSEIGVCFHPLLENMDASLLGLSY
jgi:hypothetical protein